MQMTIDTDHERKNRRIWFDKQVQSITIGGIYNVGDYFGDDYARGIVVTFIDGETLDLSLGASEKEHLALTIEPDEDDDE